MEKAAHRASLALTLLTAPVIYAMVVPIALLDLTVSVYQAICFRAWGIARAPRSAFVVIDRHRLPYLNPIQKVHCVYCGYAGGVLAYAAEVAALTEQYWCPIRHETVPPRRHAHYRDFIAFGDSAAFAAHRLTLREQLAEAAPSLER